MFCRGGIKFFNTKLDGLHSTNFTIGDILVDGSDKHGNNQVCMDNFNFDQLTLYSKYQADATFMNFPIYGDGHFS